MFFDIPEQLLAQSTAQKKIPLINPNGKEKKKKKKVC